MERKSYKKSFFALLLLSSLTSCSTPNYYYTEEKQTEFIEITNKEFINRFNELAIKSQYKAANIHIEYSEEIDFYGSKIKEINSVCIYESRDDNVLYPSCYIYPTGSSIDVQVKLGFPSLFNSLNPESFLSSAQYQTFEKPYAIKNETTTITYTSFMLPSMIKTTIDDVEMTMNLSYFNEASVENLSGNVSLDDYVNYMFLKQCSKNTKQTGTFTFEASGTLHLDYNCDDEDELFCEAKPISGLHVKGSGKLVPFPQSSSRLWNTENVVFDEGDKNKISLIQQFIYSPYINPIALSTFSHYLSGDAKYIYKYNFSETEITVDIKEILDINDNKSTIKAVFDKEGYIKSYHLETQKGQNTTYVIDINYHFE